MIGSADVYLFDEPTSGLVLKRLRARHRDHPRDGAQQDRARDDPPAELEDLPDVHKAMLLDKGGKLVFFGTPREMLAYFAEAEHEQHFGTELGGCPACGTTRPEFIFDVLETPLRDLSGDIIYEENNQWPTRARAPFLAGLLARQIRGFRLLQDVKQVPLRRDPVLPLPPAPPQKVREPIRWHDEWTQLRTLLRRAFTSKLRNRANLIITLGVAPLLALLIATILRYSDSGRYDFATAFHIPTLHLPRAARRDVPRPDEQRRRHHPRPRHPSTRTQSQRPARLLHRREVHHAGVVCPRPVHALCADRQLPSSRSAGCSGRTWCLHHGAMGSAASLRAWSFPRSSPTARPRPISSRSSSSRRSSSAAR